MLCAISFSGTTISSFVPSTAQAWTLLLVAGLLEVGWAVGSYRIALVLPARTRDEDAPVGTGYAVWVGIGAAGAALLGVVLLGEPASLQRKLSLLLIVAGVVGLRVFSAA